ncbi:MAG: bacillithiol system redox-active protein YtxJ [Gemmatimonadetes bacterium]|nr:bacillithiol system redox-active protein YtxJ [Gemmatimonadota bacterium]
MKRIDDAALEQALEAELAVIYKHSPICGSSHLAVRQVRAFAENHPEVPVYVVDVIAQRELSRRIAQQVGVGHESPQVIVLRQGATRWNGSHFEVTAEALARHAAPL